MRATPITAAAALLTAGMLAGCGVAGTNFQPGVAADVGDRTVSTGKVDEITTNYCAAIAEALQLQDQAAPLSYLRQGVAASLTLVQAAEQIEDEYAVELGAEVEQQRAEVEARSADLPAEQRDAVVELELAGGYVEAVTVALGEQLIAEDGEEGADPAERGSQEFYSWIEREGVELNPIYGLDVVDGEFVTTDTGVSVAVGDVAAQGLSEQPDIDYAKALPSSQRCG
ncbi:MAG: hypothetical protein WKF79_01385 [Nocardioides sp.]